MWEYSGWEWGENLLADGYNRHLVLSVIQDNIDFEPTDERSIPELDHIFPRSRYEKRYPSQVNRIGNFHLLEKSRNRNKLAQHPEIYFTDWDPRVLEQRLINRSLLGKNQVVQFIQERTQSIVNILDEFLRL
jgi:CRISPR/Cas system Type II protein with McrA/HNH and RuvC-like nuclease domain